MAPAFQVKSSRFPFRTLPSLNSPATNVATDSDGQAQVTLTGGESAGSGTVTVSVQDTFDGVTDVNIAYLTGAITTGSDDYTYEAYLVPSSTTYAEYADITESTTRRISSASPGTVLVRFSDIEGNPQVGSLVTFTLVGDASHLLHLAATT